MAARHATDGAVVGVGDVGAAQPRARVPSRLPQPRAPTAARAGRQLPLLRPAQGQQALHQVTRLVHLPEPTVSPGRNRMLAELLDKSLPV